MRAKRPGALVAGLLLLGAGPLRADWSYEVVASGDARTLQVSATLDEGAGSLVLEEGMAPFVSGLEARTPQGTWTSLGRHGAAFAACPAYPCALRYRLALVEAARRLDDRDVAFAQGGAVVASPSSWLIHPEDEARGRYRFRVQAPGGFVCGVRPDPASSAWSAPAADLSMAPWAAFGALDVSDLAVGRATVQLAVAPGPLAVTPDDLRRWVRDAAGAAAGWYGRLPVDRVLVLVVSRARGGVGLGTTIGHGGAAILVSVGPSASAAGLARDWVLTHEMVHLGLPNLPGPSRWMEEGLATWVEPLARARAGLLPETEAWRELMEGLPRGLPKAGDGGLDGTRSWGRTYWGGALFWMTADLEIRRLTQGRRGLEDALRGVLDAGGSIETSASPEEVLAQADDAVGQRVLVPLYREWSRKPVRVDLEATWKALGLAAQGGGVRVGEAGPEAVLRRALSAPR